MRVVFNYPEEFLREVKTQVGNSEVKDRLARLCFNFRSSKQFAGLYYVQLVAGFIGRHGYLYELEAPMGDALRFPGGAKTEGDKQAEEPRDLAMNTLKGQLAELGFEIRSGRFSLAQ